MNHCGSPVAIFVFKLGMHKQVATQLDFGDGWQRGSAFLLRAK
jgi:hypothetical protein